MEMEEDMPDLVIDHKRSKDSDFAYFCDTDNEDSESDRSRENINAQRRKYNMTDLITTALMANKYGVSHRAAAAIASAVLIDYGFVTPEEDHLLVTEKKIRDRRERLLAESRAARTEHVSTPGEVTMISWDAKETTPYAQKEISGRRYKFCGDKQDTYTMTYEPQGQYLCQFTVKGEATKECPYAKLAAITIYGTITGLGISWDKVEVCGHDTENTNTW